MREITLARALGEAIREEMIRDDTVFIIGVEVGLYGGCFRVTEGLFDEFGAERVIDTPISESALVGAAAGAAVMGMKPVAEVMYQDFATLVMDQILNGAAKLRYVHAGQATVPMVLRAPFGASGAGAHHSQSIEAMFCHIPGVKVVIPSTPYDAKGLLKSAIRDPNPVLFFEHKLTYGIKDEIPDEDYTVSLGKADIKLQGKDLTIVTWGLMVHKALNAAAELAKKGIELEVIDLRTLVPLDTATIVSSVKKTSRLMIVHEACKTGGYGSEITDIVTREAFGYLDSPVHRVATPDTTIPFSRPLLEAIIPDEKDIVAVALSMTGNRITEVENGI
ncbi:MAG: alpha-ketoacid dehydrogenase subunit beta [Dehalococcoidales bacterium]|nr:alpha-ketoacid dehydrogenase subunit beta [Dehalococcoidales bacterium]